MFLGLTLSLLMVCNVLISASMRMPLAIHGRTRFVARPNDYKVEHSTLQCTPLKGRSDSKIGLKYSLDKEKALPDALFVKRKYISPWFGHSNVHAEWDFDMKRINIFSTWSPKNGGVAISAIGNSDDKLTSLGGRVSRRLGWKSRLSLRGTYNLPENYKVSTRLDMGDTSLGVKYNSKSKDAILLAIQRLNPKEYLSPSINLYTGKLSYKWRKVLTGGLLEGVFRPGEFVTLKWADRSQSNTGQWVSLATIPISNIRNSQLTISRSWSF